MDVILAIALKVIAVAICSIIMVLIGRFIRYFFKIKLVLLLPVVVYLAISVALIISGYISSAILILFSCISVQAILIASYKYIIDRYDFKKINSDRVEDFAFFFSKRRMFFKADAKNLFNSLIDKQILFLRVIYIKHDVRIFALISEVLSSYKKNQFGRVKIYTVGLINLENYNTACGVMSDREFWRNRLESARIARSDLERDGGLSQRERSRLLEDCTKQVEFCLASALMSHTAKTFEDDDIVKLEFQKKMIDFLSHVISLKIPNCTFELIDGPVELIDSFIAGGGNHAMMVGVTPFISRNFPAIIHYPANLDLISSIKKDSAVLAPLISSMETDIYFVSPFKSIDISKNTDVIDAKRVDIFVDFRYKTIIMDNLFRYFELCVRDLFRSKNSESITSINKNSQLKDDFSKISSKVYEEMKTEVEGKLGDNLDDLIAASYFSVEAADKIEKYIASVDFDNVFEENNFSVDGYLAGLDQEISSYADKILGSMDIDISDILNPSP